VTFRRLVVGTDGSDSARRAVDHAARLAARIDAEVVVTHALPRRRRPAHDRDRVTASYDIGTSILRDAAAWYRDRVDIRSLLREGPAAEALIAAAREEHADLLVVGNRGLGTRQLMIGNVPSRVAHHAPCTVLIVHTTDSIDEEPYRKVLVATDGSPTATAAVAAGGELAAVLGAEVRLLHVGDPARGATVLEEAARSLPVRALGRTVAGEPGARIVEVAGEERCDLVVVGNKGMTGSRRFLASVPSRVARHSPCHVLLVKTT
jgi:nucleotide-binding universal stress UspA family protein